MIALNLVVDKLLASEMDVIVLSLVAAFSYCVNLSLFN